MLAFIDKKSRMMLVFAIVGMTVALTASQFNAILLELNGDNYFMTTVNFTPICEELLKGLPVLFFAFFMAESKDDIITIAYSTGFGFAMLENITILLQNYSSISLMWAFSRCIGAGLMHGLCTAAIGLGMTYVKENKRLFVVGTLGLLILSILYHSIFNIIVQADGNLCYFGLVLPIVSYIPFLIVYFKNTVHIDEKYKHRILNLSKKNENSL